MSKNSPDHILTYDQILQGQTPAPENFGKIVVHYWRPDAAREKCDTTELQVEAIRAAIDPAIIEQREELVLLLLTDQMELIGPYVLGLGTEEEVTFDRREILRLCLIVPGVAHMVLGHNHPDGYVHPSTEDVDTANSLLHAARICGLNLHDSIIINRTEHFSLLENYLLRA